MTSVDHIERWHEDLVQLASEQGLGSDPVITNELSLVAIEIESMKILLPDQSEALAKAVSKMHTQRIADRCVSILQSLVGYYALPEQPKGQNEPIIGSLQAHDLRTRLMANEVDIYAAKETIALLLEANQGESD